MATLAIAGVAFGDGLFRRALLLLLLLGVAAGDRWSPSAATYWDIWRLPNWRHLLAMWHVAGVAAGDPLATAGHGCWRRCWRRLWPAIAGRGWRCSLVALLQCFSGFLFQPLPTLVVKNLVVTKLVVKYHTSGIIASGRQQRLPAAIPSASRRSQVMAGHGRPIQGWMVDGRVRVVSV